MPLDEEREVDERIWEPVFDEPTCPMCGGPPVYLGILGSLTWFTCRNCGMQFNRKEERS